MTSTNVLVVSQSLEAQQAFTSALGQFGLVPIVASTAREAEAILNRLPITLVFCSDELPGDGIGGLLHWTSQQASRVPLIVLSRIDDWGRYLHFLHAGAHDYILDPPSSHEIERLVRNALDNGQFTTEERVRSFP